MFLGKSDKKAPRGLGFNFIGQRCPARVDSDSVRSVSEGLRPLAQMPVRLRHPAYLDRKTQPHKNGDRFMKHSWFHFSLLPNPDTLWRAV
jgi:hypothetical protein